MIQQDGNEMEQRIREAADEAERELSSLYSAPGGKAALIRLAKKMAGRDSGTWDPVSWVPGMLLLGLLEAGRTGAVQRYLDRWMEDGTQVLRVDDALTGFVLVRLWEETREDRYRKAADEVWHFLQKAPVTKGGALIYYPSRTSSVFADGVGQSALFLSRYGSVFQETAAGEMAAAQLLQFLHEGFDRNTGLMYHGYQAQPKLKQGIIGWGRAAGWLLMGWSGYLSCYANRKVRQTADGMATDTVAGRTAELMAAFRELTRNVCRCQRKDHLFSWQLEAVEGPADTSATGMIAWSLESALEAGVPCDFRDDDAIELANALTNQINGGKVYTCSGECIDFGQYPQVYGSYPWGQGAVLAFLSLVQKRLPRECGNEGVLC